MAKFRKIKQSTKDRYRREILRDFEKIKSSPDLYDSLSTRKKLIYKAYEKKPWEKIYRLEGKQFYDYGGAFANMVDKDLAKDFPELQKTRNLDKVFNTPQLRSIVKRYLANQVETEFLPTWQRQDFSTSLAVQKGGKLQTYKIADGTSLDFAKQLKQLQKKGFSIDVDGKKGSSALKSLQDFERKQKDKNARDLEPGQKFVIRHQIKIDPFKKKIFIDTKESNSETWGDTDRNVSVKK